MQQYNQTTEKTRSNSFASTPEKQNSESKTIIDITAYQTEEKISTETSAFGQVMSQMNIADMQTFDAHYTQLWQQASENKQLLSVLICDIDSFKAYNDNYGHQAAAFMLLVIGLALKNRCEEFGCFLARYKADKFIILIKGEELKKVEEIAESLRQAVEQSNTEHKFSNVSNIVTLSIGISHIYPTSMKMLIEEADTALSFAQISGNSQTTLPSALDSADSALDSVIASSPQEELNNVASASSTQKNRESAINSVAADNQKEEKLNKAVSPPLPLESTKPSSADLDLQQEEKLKVEKSNYDKLKSDFEQLKLESEIKIKPRQDSVRYY